MRTKSPKIKKDGVKLSNTSFLHSKFCLISVPFETVVPLCRLVITFSALIFLPLLNCHTRPYLISQLKLMARFHLHLFRWANKWQYFLTKPPSTHPPTHPTTWILLTHPGFRSCRRGLKFCMYIQICLTR